MLTSDAAGDYAAAGEAETLVFDSDREVILSKDTDEIDSDVIIIRSASPPHAGDA